MSCSGRWRVVAVVVAVLGVGAGGGGLLPAGAADEDPAWVAKVEAFEEQVEAHRRAGDLEALEKDVRAIVALHAECKGEDRVAAKAREDLIKCLGILITKYRETSLRKAIIESLGAMGDRSGSRYVRPYLKEPRGDTVDPLFPVALEAAAKIQCDSFVPPLLKLATKAKKTSIQVAAMNALGRFGHCTRYREKILEALVDHVRRYRPGQGRIKDNQVDPSKGPVGANPGEGTRGRWQSLGAALPKVLNELTGQNIPSLEDWITIVEAHGRNLDPIFVHDT